MMRSGGPFLWLATLLGCGAGHPAARETAPPPTDPILLCGPPVDVIYWGYRYAIRFDECANGNGLIANTDGPACGAPWTDDASRLVIGDPTVPGTCAVDLDPSDWCRSYIPCWYNYGPSCPDFAEFASLMNLADPSLSASVRSCTWRGDGYLTVTLPVEDGVERAFLFAVPTGGDPQDAALVTVELLTTPSWIDLQ